MSKLNVQDIVRKPFSSAAENTSASFWAEYCLGRPSPPENFLEKILAYHTAHSDGRCEVAHDVGTGPGNIAGRLARYFKTVVASDPNESALNAGPGLLPEKYREKVIFVECSAEELALSAKLPAGASVGETDLVTVTECMPLLDNAKSFEAIHALLKPKGTLAVYFYGRPIFAGENSDACNNIYEGIASRICSFFHPFKGTPGEPFHRRSATALVSWLDNIQVPSSQWSDVERHKWNNDRPLVFNGKEGYDFEWEYADHREPSERIIETIDRDFWRQTWALEDVKKYLATNYVKHAEAAGERYAELNLMYEELEKAMGGPGAKQKISFPVCLILASKR